MRKGNVKQAAARNALAEKFVEAMSMTRGTLKASEREAMALANELVRCWLARALTEMSKRYDDEVVVDGQRYKRHSSGTVRYHSLCGSIAVSRDVYRQVGVHNGPTVVPLELEAELLENATPALAASVVQGFAAMPLRQYEQEMASAHRRVPSRSTLERIGKRVGTQVREQLHVLEKELRADEVLPPDTRSISIGVDRTTVPMAEPTGKKATPARGRVRKRPQPVAVAYRMAYVATVAMHDRRGEELRSVRLAATAGEGPTMLMERLAAELEHLLAQRASLPVVVVQDGAPELWTLVEECLSNMGISPALRLIDRYHLETRLAEVCEAIGKTPERGKSLLAHWRRCLDRTDSTLPRIVNRLDRMVHGAGDDSLPWAEIAPTLTGQRAATVKKHLTYLQNCRDRVRYAAARRRGFPVGSGVTEGACKSLVGARFKRSGQRWFESGASSCLLLRSMYLNERLAPAIERLTGGSRCLMN